MPAIQPLSRRKLEDLEQYIIGLSTRQNVMEYEFLVLIREYDLRQGYKAYHYNNCAEWLSMTCGMTPTTAREKLRVANALFDLPLIAGAFQSGRLSYSKARSLTRVATPKNEEELLEFALSVSAHKVDEQCRRIRNAQKHLSTVDANRAHQGRRLSCTTRGDGTMMICIELPEETGECVMKAVEMAMAELDADDETPADDYEEPWNEREQEEVRQRFLSRQADAMVRVAQGFMAGGQDKNTCTADHYQVMVYVDEKALRGVFDEKTTSDLPIETVRRLCCDGALVVVENDEKGHPLNVGRRHRVVQPALKRALYARDRCCVYPGCTHTRFLDAHHVEHWADGGETSLDNTVLLCSRHHRLLHEGAYRMKRDCEGEWRFRRV
jgi:hypothetical protein